MSTLREMNMKQVTFDYSLKNILIPSEKEYILELISSLEIFRTDIAWRSYIYLNPADIEKKNTYDFRTTKCAPSVPELKEFETELIELVRNVKFRRTVRNTLQNTLRSNMSENQQDQRLYVATDKSNNYYRMELEDHQKLLHRSVTKDYLKVNDEVVNEVNLIDKAIVEDLEIENRVYSHSRNEAFISLKDHKDNFFNNPKCRLLNSAKSSVGKVSKQILSRIVSNLRNLSLIHI